MPQLTSSFSPIWIQIDKSFTLGGCGHKMGLPFCSTPNKASSMALRGKVTSISHSLQLLAGEAEFLVIWLRSGATFLPLVPIHRVKPLPYVENTWTKVDLIQLTYRTMVPWWDRKLRKLEVSPMPCAQNSGSENLPSGRVSSGKESSVALPKGMEFIWNGVWRRATENNSSLQLRKTH